MDPDLFDQLQQNAQLQQQARANQHLQQINQNIAAEQALPKCPYCGGGVIVGFPKCKNCASNLIWYQGYVAALGQEKELKEMVDGIISREESNRIAKKKSDRRTFKILAGGWFSLIILAMLMLWVRSWVDTWGDEERMERFKHLLTVVAMEYENVGEIGGEKDDEYYELIGNLSDEQIDECYQYASKWRSENMEEE